MSKDISSAAAKALMTYMFPVDNLTIPPIAKGTHQFAATSLGTTYARRPFKKLPSRHSPACQGLETARAEVRPPHLPPCPAARSHHLLIQISPLPPTRSQCPVITKTVIPFHKASSNSTIFEGVGVNPDEDDVNNEDYKTRLLATNSERGGSLWGLWLTAP